MARSWVCSCFLSVCLQTLHIVDLMHDIKCVNIFQDLFMNDHVYVYCISAWSKLSLAIDISLCHVFTLVHFINLVVTVGFFLHF